MKYYLLAIALLFFIFAESLELTNTNPSLASWIVPCSLIGLVLVIFIGIFHGIIKIIYKLYLSYKRK
jgi:hypothetical protein